MNPYYLTNIPTAYPAIPETVFPFAKNSQPHRFGVELSMLYAHMDMDTFNKLQSYDHIPSGLFVGKMWKRYDHKKNEWYLFYVSKNIDDGSYFYANNPTAAHVFQCVKIKISTTTQQHEIYRTKNSGHTQSDRVCYSNAIDLER